VDERTHPEWTGICRARRCGPDGVAERVQATHAAVDLRRPGHDARCDALGALFAVAAGQVCVGAVAERRCAGTLAQAEQRFFLVELRDVRKRLEAGTGVRPVAERLIPGTPAA